MSIIEYRKKVSKIGPADSTYKSLLGAILENQKLQAESENNDKHHLPGTHRGLAVWWMLLLEAFPLNLRDHSLPTLGSLVLKIVVREGN